MSREYNYGGSSLIVDNIEELFENGAVSTKAISNIKQVVGQQRQTKDLTDLKEQLENATSDGVITVSEKPGLKREWASLVSSFASISDRFETDGNIVNVTVYTTLKSIMGDLTPIMEDVFADMNSDYTNSAIISDITLRFVTAWEYLTFCSQLLEGKLSLSDRHILQISENRSIVSTLEVKASLLIIEDGLYVDYTGMSSVYPDSDFVWRKTSDEEFVRTGRTLTLALSDMSSETETFSLTFTHTYADAQEEGNDVIIVKSISFSISTGTLLEWAWSDAPTKAELLIDPLAIWQGERTENESKKYLWRRETSDVLLPDADRTWTYFRESGLDGIDGYSRAQLTLYKRSASGEPSKSDLGTITYTFATNAYSGTLGEWSTSIPSGEGELYAIYASAFFNGATDTIQPNEWTTPAKLSTDGAKGEPGMSIYTVLLFKRSASIPSTPSETVTYNFHTNTLTGADGWYREPPASDGNPIYAITATAASNTGTDVIRPSEWSTPMIFVKDGNDGEPGKGIDSIDYSYALSTTEDQPDDSQFTEGVKTMTSINKYLWQKEVITYTTGDYKTTYALIGVYGDTGNGISGIAYYYALSTSSTQPSSITSTTLPIMTSTNKYLWQKEVISYTNGESKTTVALIGVYGDKGENGDDGKDGFSTIIEWCLSTSNYALEANNEIRLGMYSSNYMLWGAYPLSHSSTWIRYKPAPTVERPYIWERVSYDSGETWSDPYCITSYPNRNITLRATKMTFDTDDAYYVLTSQTIFVHVDKYLTTAPAKWTWTVNNALNIVEGKDSIKVIVPVGLIGESIKVSCICDGVTRSITIRANIVMKRTPTKQSMVYASQLASIKTRDDGSPLLTGDYRVVIVTGDDGEDYHVPYHWNGTGWIASNSKNSSNYSEILSNVLGEILSLDSTVPEISAIHGFFSDIATNYIFAEMIESLYIKIKGAIYGGSYDKDGNKIDDGVNGFHLSKDGILQAFKASLNDVFISSYDDGGQTILETVKGQTGTTEDLACTATHWNQADLFDYIPSGTKDLACSCDGTSAYLYRYEKNIDDFVSRGVSSSDMGGMTDSGSSICPCDGTLTIDAIVSTESWWGLSSYGSVSVSINGSNVFLSDMNHSASIAVKQGDIIEYELSAYGDTNTDWETGEMTTVTASVDLSLSLIATYPTIIVANRDPTSSVSTTTTIYNTFAEVDMPRSEVLTCSLFNSSEHITLALYNTIVAQTEALPYSALYDCVPENSQLTYQSKSWTIYQVRKTTNDITFNVYDSSDVYKTFIFAFDSFGDPVEAVFKLYTVGTSLKTATLLPANTSDSVGTAGKEYAGVYTKALYLDGQEIYIENGTVKVRS